MEPAKAKELLSTGKPTMQLEVEIRGLLSEDQYHAAVAALTNTGAEVQVDNRKTTFFIMPEKTLKVTSREDGTMAKIALKIGEIRSAKAQREIEIPFSPADHDKVVEMFMGLGFSEIQVTTQKRINFKLPGGVEIAMKWSKDLGFHFEADCVVGTVGEIEGAREKLTARIAPFGLVPMTEQEFRELCDRVDAEYRDAKK